MALTMINPASSWFKIAELPVVKQLRQQTVNGKELLIADEIFDKTSERIAKLVNKTWLCRYPRCCHLIYDNRSEFKLHFEYLSLKNQFGIWQYKFPLQIKLILTISNIYFLNFSIIMFYLQENCIHVRIP